tara:strand:- start:106431 stop:107270 length:840 start_codon:yes stop_codon:yes gene_type:complete
MLSQDQIAKFHRNGFLNGGSLLSGSEIHELRNELDRILSIGAKGFPKDGPRPAAFHKLGNETNRESCIWQIVNIWEVSDAYFKLINHPFIVKAISQLTEACDVLVWHDQILYKTPGNSGAINWHQDAPLWPVISPMTPVSAWVALDDTNLENGCLWMVPGSHCWGNQIKFLRTQAHLKRVEEFGDIKGFTPKVDQVIPQPWPVKKGEVSFHHSLTWHGSPLNKSQQPRRAIAIHYMTEETRFIASGEHVMKSLIDLPDGEFMNQAGEHFPFVMKDGIMI